MGDLLFQSTLGTPEYAWPNQIKLHDQFVVSMNVQWRIQKIQWDDDFFQIEHKNLQSVFT